MRFTVRDLLWVTILMAVMAGWYRDRISMARAIDWSEAQLAAERAADKAKLQTQLDRLEKQIAGSSRPLSV